MTNTAKRKPTPARPVCADCHTYLDGPGVKPGRRGICGDCWDAYPSMVTISPVGIATDLLVNVPTIDIAWYREYLAANPLGCGLGGRYATVMVDLDRVLAERRAA
jgi:hypothetical protein